MNRNVRCMTSMAITHSTQAHSIVPSPGSLLKISSGTVRTADAIAFSLAYLFPPVGFGFDLGGMGGGRSAKGPDVEVRLLQKALWLCVLAHSFNASLSLSFFRSLQLPMRLTFQEAMNGVEKEIQFQTRVRCNTCGGSGAKPGTQPVSCRTCDGSGVVRDTDPVIVCARVHFCVRVRVPLC